MGESSHLRGVLSGEQRRWQSTSGGRGDRRLLRWRRVIPRLVDHYRVICPDLRGAGWGTRLAVPTRVLIGGDDPVVRQEFLSGHEAYVEDLTVHLVSGASHFIADERPEAVVDLALEFFAWRSD